MHARPSDVVDPFVYVVVLNLAIEYIPSVKNKILGRLRSATTRRIKIVAALSLGVVAAGSKLVVLALIDFIFGDSVSLGGFLPVTLLVIALMASRAAVRRLLYDTAAPV